MDPQKLNQYVSKISIGASKVISTQTDPKVGLKNASEQISQPTTAEPLQLFLPQVENNRQRVFYGKHYTLFFISLLSEFYKRMLFVRILYTSQHLLTPIQLG